MLVIREMQIKTTRDHYPSFRMTESKEVNTKKKKKRSEYQMLAKIQSNWDIAGRNVKWYSHFGKHFGSHLQ